MGYDSPSRDPRVDRLANTTSPPPVPMSLIEGACIEQRACLNELHQVVTELEHQLRTVLAPQPLAGGAGVEKAPQPQLLVEHINLNTQSINGVRARLVELAKRLQV